MNRDWMAAAACRDVDPELFFPRPGGDNGLAAKKICRTCPVAQQCASYAVITGATAGVWGGRSPKRWRPAGGTSRLEHERKQRDAIILRLSRGELTDAEIAEQAGCDSRTVLRVRARNGVSRKAAA